MKNGSKVYILLYLFFSLFSLSPNFTHPRFNSFSLLLKGCRKCDVDNGLSSSLVARKLKERTKKSIFKYTCLLGLSGIMQDKKSGKIEMAITEHVFPSFLRKTKIRGLTKRAGVVNLEACIFFLFPTSVCK